MARVNAPAQWPAKTTTTTLMMAAPIAAGCHARSAAVAAAHRPRAMSAGGHSIA